MLANSGASVTKIEPTDGDPMRGLFVEGFGVDMPVNPPFELERVAEDRCEGPGCRIGRVAPVAPGRHRLS